MQDFSNRGYEEFVTRRKVEVGACNVNIMDHVPISQVKKYVGKIQGDTKRCSSPKNSDLISMEVLL